MYSLFKQQFQQDFYKYVCLSLDESYEFLTVRANIIGWDHSS